jgi:glucose-1-phosphate thymidylyltransferase
VLLSLEGQPQDLALTPDGSNVSALLPVANRPLVQWAADAMGRAGVERIVVVCTSACAPVVREALAAHRAEHPTELLLLEVPRGVGQLAAVLTARELLPPGPLVLHTGDGVVLDGLDAPLQRFRRGGLDALVLAVPAPVPARERRGPLALQPRPNLAGIQVVGPLALLAAEQLEAERGAAATLDDLPEAVRRAGGRVEDVVSPRAWRFTGEPHSLLDVTALALEDLAPGPLPPLDADVVVQGPVEVDPTARIRSSKLRGPVLVGPGVRIEDSYVGPFTCLGPGVVLDGAEIEHSIMLADAEVNHVGVRIEDSVIGAGARVHRTFAMPTALRVQLGAGGRVALS